MRILLLAAALLVSGCTGSGDDDAPERRALDEPWGCDGQPAAPSTIILHATHGDPPVPAAAVRVGLQPSFPGGPIMEAVFFVTDAAGCAEMPVTRGGTFRVEGFASGCRGHETVDWNGTGFLRLSLHLGDCFWQAPGNLTVDPDGTVWPPPSPVPSACAHHVAAEPALIVHAGHVLLLPPGSSPPALENATLDVTLDGEPAGTVRTDPHGCARWDGAAGLLAFTYANPDPCASGPEVVRVAWDGSGDGSVAMGVDHPCA